MRGRHLFPWSSGVVALWLIVLLITPVLAASAPAGDALGRPALPLDQEPIAVPLESVLPVSPYDPSVFDPSIPAPEPPPSEVNGQASAAFLPANGRPGIYAARDYANLDPATYHIVGAHQSYYWSQLEPSEGSYNWAPVDDFITSRAALGKPVGIGLMTYLGRVSASGGEDPFVTPNWLVQQKPSLKIACTASGLTVNIPRYWDQTYLTKYGNFVRALANHLRANPNLDRHVEFIYMGVGAYGETQPCDDADNNCLRSAGLDSATWINTVNAITDIYKGAFQSGGYYKTVLLLSWPNFTDRWEATEFRRHAMQQGIGLAPAGMQADLNYVDMRFRTNNDTSWYGRGAFDYILGQAEKDSFWQANYTGNTPPFPVAHEGYHYMTPSPGLLWWGILGTLHRHADYITAERDILYTGKPSDPVKPPKTEHHYAFDFANKYLGRSLSNTPGVWAVMRESGCRDEYLPQRGNFHYWLYQDNTIAGGVTQAVSALSEPIDPVCRDAAGINPRVLFNQTQLKGNGGEVWTESYVTRKTQQASNNRKIFFRVDDGFMNGGTNTVRVRVRYYDYGTDTWNIKYDGVSSREQATATVHKTNSRTWKWQEFIINDARFANGQPYGSPGTDLYIDCLGDGDEYIHMVEILREGGPASFDIPLSAGANLISLPVVPSDPATTAVFAPIWNNFQKAYAYDINGVWKSYDKSKPINSLTTLDTNMGLWVYVNAACTLTVTGTPTSQSTIALKGPQFGNIVGYPTRTERPLSDAFGGIWSYVAKVVEYTGTTPKTYTRGVPVNSLTTMKPGHGYIIYVDQNCNWTVNP